MSIPSDTDIAQAGWARPDDETFLGHIGEIFERRRDGKIEIALRTDERHRNLSGIVHGGVIMTVLDRAIGINCRQAVQTEPISTGTMTVNFLRPVKTGEFLVASCEVRKAGRSAVFAEAQAVVGDRIVATASAICIKRGVQRSP